jgi:GNAT superfamily N-acetyltransferase
MLDPLSKVSIYCYFYYIKILIRDVGAISEASHTLTEAYLSNKSLEWSARNLDASKRNSFLMNLFKNMINNASLQSRDFAVQVDGCKGVLVWSNRSQLFSWPQTINTFKYARLLGWTAALKAFVKLQTGSADKVRRKLMAHYPKHIVIGFIGILPQEQSKGLGTALVEYVLDKADEAHYPVYVEATDYQTVKFFERLGFVSQGQMELSKDGMASMTPMIRLPVMLNEPKSLQVRPGRRDSN